MVTAELAARLGRPADDFELRVFGGAIMGAMMAAMIPMLDNPSPEILEAADRALEFVEKGMPL
jgi:hypothetical protein